LRVSKDASPTPGREAITPQLISAVADRLASNKGVRRTLPGRGRLHIDRQLPFLCVYRRPPTVPDEGTEHLVTSEASYLVAPGDRSHHAAVARLARAVVTTLRAEFGAFLLLEVWAGEWDPESVPIPAVPAMLRPRFRVLAPKNDDLDTFVDALQTALSRIRTARQAAEVELVRTARCRPAGLPPLLTASEAASLDCLHLGLEVRPVYRNPRTGEPYPLVLRELRRGLTRALRRAFHAFACSCTTHSPVHFHVLGRRAVVKAVWDVDRRLAAVADGFDSLLQVTPVNVEEAWHKFRRRRFEKAPVFRYRPLPVDPVRLKRRLYEAPLERIEDPALWHLFREKQDELDRRLTMLLDLNTSRFIHGSIQLFGGVDDDFLQLAQDLLDRLPPRARDDTGGGFLDAAAFSRLAEDRISHYRRQWPEVDSEVQLRTDTAGGLMVSRGSLLVATGAQIPAARAEALLAHEIDTHILTYHNGRAQPLKQLYSGLAGYDSFQEGLAVLAEYLVGGLSRPRLRLLAARVLAVRHLQDGASFSETFQLLSGTHGFDQRAAFMMTMRVYRGGGLTKDAVYLRGLRQVLDYLAGGGELEPMFMGKLAVRHVPIIRELCWRKVLQPPPLRPRYLDAPGAAERLERVRAGLTLLQLIEKTPRTQSGYYGQPDRRT
jgi:uncharacterized protein (TIGR02421 family)